jgi:heterodisulfide reductase subunit C
MAVGLFTRNILRIIRNIRLGHAIDRSDRKSDRWKHMARLALGQSKMTVRPIAGLLHIIVYVGFVVINIELLEIILDGFLGTHRVLAPYLGSAYDVLISVFEVFALLVIVAVTLFWLRRNALRISRFWKPEIKGWPKKDADYILYIELVLMFLFLTMNAADPAANFIISGWIKPSLSNLDAHQLHTIEQSAWWMHILGIYGFMNYLPYSKHLHIVLAFPNAYYASLEPKGKMHNMVAIQNEVLYAMQPELAPTNATTPEKFGAKDVMDLSWKNLMDAYSCTECGRCSAACPANSTGKLLSPRKIMMDTRDRLEIVGKNIDANGQFVDDGKSLLNDHITIEELRACTTCNACVEECPVSISPMDIIVELRRSLIMEDSNAPSEWNGMFSNIENNFAPWKFAPDDRDAWTKQS